MWLSLLGAVLCVAVMFLISWATALITFCVVLALYLIVAYRKPDVNWGSTTQAQTYKNALMSVQQLNYVEDHVKNYRPQILVLSGLPNARPVLVDFAYMLTKNLSLLVCGHVLRGSGSQKYRNYLKERASNWFRKHRVKGFYALVDGEDFESGTRALMQASGIGKLKPNIILMGYKTDWQTCERKELVQYFNVMHKVSCGQVAPIPPSLITPSPFAGTGHVSVCGHFTCAAGSGLLPAAGHAGRRLGHRKLQSGCAAHTAAQRELWGSAGHGARSSQRAQRQRGLTESQCIAG